MEPKRKMTKLEASRLGTAAMRIAVAAQKQARIDEYLKHPDLCKCCQKPLTYYQHINRYVFCSSSCSAKYHKHKSVSLEQRQKLSNSIREKLGLPKIKIGEFKHCPICNKVVKNPNSKYCSTACYRKAEWIDKCKSIADSGTIPGDHCGETKPNIAKRYIEEQTGHKCAICGISEHNGTPVPLQIHHIDGDATNGKLENLQLLCPICHAMTENFGHTNNHKSNRPSRKKYWTTAEDRLKIAIYDAEMNAPLIPKQPPPLSDIRDDFITDEDIKEWTTC